MRILEPLRSLDIAVLRFEESSVIDDDWSRWSQPRISAWRRRSLIRQGLRMCRLVVVWKLQLGEAEAIADSNETKQGINEKSTEQGTRKGPMGRMGAAQRPNASSAEE